ncbi:MAG: proline racemase family protein [bacterium]
MKNKLTIPQNWPKITTIEAHTAGEPLRIITGGIPDIPGKTILAKRRYAQKHLDHFRTGLMWEPRGHADMYGAILTEPVTPDGDLGVLFLHNEGFSTMCGHGIIALTKVVLDTGMIFKAGDDPVLNIDAPAGRITATGHRKKGVVKNVSFLNVPSFVYQSDLQIEIPDLGQVKYDLAFGGAFYAFCNAVELGLNLIPENHDILINAGKKIKKAVMDSISIIHPLKKELGFLYGTIFIGPPENKAHHSRNVCIFAEGEVDRSPTGTGVSARAAIHYNRKELNTDQTISIESILGTTMDVKITDITKVGTYQAVIPEVSGTAHITGQNEFYFDPDDPLKKGFIFR